MNFPFVIPTKEEPHPPEQPNTIQNSKTHCDGISPSGRNDKLNTKNYRSMNFPFVIPTKEEPHPPEQSNTIQNPKTHCDGISPSGRNDKLNT